MYTYFHLVDSEMGGGLLLLLYWESQGFVLHVIWL